MKVLYCNNLFSHTRRCISLSSTKQLHLSISNEKSFTDDDYQVLHRSAVPTMHFQKSLLRLAIPELEKTCSRYLRSQKAILKPEDFSETEKIVKEFGGGVGKELHDVLKATDKANKHTSYISGPWFDMYLSDRSPVVLNYNPFVAFLPEERKGYAHPVIRATNVLVSSMRFLNTLKKGILEPEVYHLYPAKSDTPFFRKVVKWTPSAVAAYAAYAFKAFPLDMSQFKNLFHSTRVPCPGKDRIAAFPDAKHMLVMNNGHFYVFDLYDADGNLFCPSHVHACVSHIYADRRPPPPFPLSFMTGEDRDTWAGVRESLLAAGNEEALRLVDSAAFNLVLDEAEVGMDPVKCYRTFLYGDGGNRWFDKSFSLVCTEDGMVALNFEHAWGDGVAVMRYLNEVAAEVAERPFIHPDSPLPTDVDASQFVRKLEFRLTPGLEEAISRARASYEERTRALGVHVLETDVLSKGLCKKHKVSPDAMMQLGFQLAFHLQTGSTAATYESCSTSAFKHGRTETLRPATLETSAFCKAVAKGDAPKEELKAALVACSAMHGKLTKEAAMGQGFDRHLFGLRKVAEGRGGALPALFADPAYALMNHNVLSTSTLPSNKISFGGFAPVVTDGFGVGYQIKEERLGLVLSSYPPHRDGAAFLECASQAYRTIRDILDE